MAWWQLDIEPIFYLVMDVKPFAQRVVINFIILFDVDVSGDIVVNLPTTGKMIGAFWTWPDDTITLVHLIQSHHSLFVTYIRKVVMSNDTLK